MDSRIKNISEEAQKLGCTVETNAVLKNYTTFRIGGECPLLIKLNGEESFLRLGRKISVNDAYFLFHDNPPIV